MIVKVSVGLVSKNFVRGSTPVKKNVIDVVLLSGFEPMTTYHSGLALLSHSAIIILVGFVTSRLKGAHLT